MKVLQWTCKAQRYIKGEAISSCWIKSAILLVLYKTELQGEVNRKAEGGASKLSADFDVLAKELASLSLSGPPPTKEYLDLECKVADDADMDIKDKKEGEEEEEEIETEEESDQAYDELNIIFRTKVKEYATTLHHFIINNLRQPRLFEARDLLQRSLLRLN